MSLKSATEMVLGIFSISMNDIPKIG